MVIRRFLTRYFGSTSFSQIWYVEFKINFVFSFQFKSIFFPRFHLVRKVLKDFKLLFPELDSSLLDKWPTIRHKPKRLNVSFDPIAAYSLSDDLYDVLLYLKAFSTHRTKFENAVNALVLISTVISFILWFDSLVHWTSLVHSEFINSRLFFLTKDATSDPVDMLKHQTDFPRIVAIFSNDGESSKYYISLKQSLISVIGSTHITCHDH